MIGSSFSICVHMLTLMSHFKDEYLSSEFIAQSININPAMVRKEMIKLKNYGLVESKEGKSGGSKIARPASDITMKEVLEAVKPKDSHILAMYRNEPHPQCTIGSQLQHQLGLLYSDIDDQVLGKLGKLTLQDFYKQFV